MVHIPAVIILVPFVLLGSSGPTPARASIVHTSLPPNLRPFSHVLIPTQHDVQRIPKSCRETEAEPAHPSALVKSVFNPSQKELFISFSET